MRQFPRVLGDTLGNMDPKDIGDLLGRVSKFAQIVSATLWTLPRTVSDTLMGTVQRVSQTLWTLPGRSLIP